jgi:hypothetical protein
MGTRADFYVGRGEQAEWLGSIAWDGYPKGIPNQLLNCTGEAAFRHAVAYFLKDREDRTLPEDGWPWPWEDSRTTDYSYAFDGERVYATCFAHGWFEADKPEPEEMPEDKTCVFPNMKDRKRRPLLGAHSGVIVVTAKGIES